MERYIKYVVLPMVGALFMFTMAGAWAQNPFWSDGSKRDNTIAKEPARPGTFERAVNHVLRIEQKPKLPRERSHDVPTGLRWDYRLKGLMVKKKPTSGVLTLWPDGAVTATRNVKGNFISEARYLQYSDQCINASAYDAAAACVRKGSRTGRGITSAQTYRAGAVARGPSIRRASGRPHTYIAPRPQVFLPTPRGIRPE